MKQFFWKFFAECCDTGRRIDVPDLKGDGWVAPGSCSSTTYHVYRFFGREWVSVSAAERGAENVANARIWFHRLGAWGSGEGTTRAMRVNNSPAPCGTGGGE